MKNSHKIDIHPYKVFAVILLIFTSLSAKPQSSIEEPLIWDLGLLMKTPQVRWVDQQSTVHALLYSGLVYKGNPTEVFAYYSNPDILNGEVSGKKFPAVVLVHGGGGKAFREWVHKWVAEGYAAIAMDLSGMDGNGDKLVHAGPDQADIYKFEEIDNGPIENVWNYHAVANVILAHSWLRSCPEVDTLNTFITGISWGGYLTCIAAALDDRFKAAAPVYGCAYFEDMETFGQNLNRLSVSGKAAWIRYFDPSAYLSSATIPFLFINGNKDRHFNIVPYHKTYHLIPEEKRFILITPGMKHGHYEGWMPHEIRYFFDHFAYGNGQLPRLDDTEICGNRISVHYKSPVPLYVAEFYYSDDTVSSNEHREWKVLHPVYDSRNGRIHCEIPAGFTYGFFYVKDHRNITGSSAFIFRQTVQSGQQ